MANPTMAIPDMELAMLDYIIDIKSDRGERPRRPSRSAELKYLTQQHIQANSDILEESEDWELWKAYLENQRGFAEPPQE